MNARHESQTGGRVQRVLIAVLFLVLIGLPLADPAAAVLDGRNGRIVFTSGRDGANDNEAQIYMRPVIGASGGGSVLRPIGIPGTQNRHASWSPDRTKVVFAAGTPGTPATEEYDLFVNDLVEGTITPLDLTQVGDGLSSDHPAWSPDGTRIAYEQQTVDNSANRDIMVKTFGTSTPAVSIASTANTEFKAAWSPDSQVIYYAIQQAVAPASNLDILKRPAAGGPASGVADASGVDEYQPSISPDGTKLCFTIQTTPGSTATAEIYTAGLPSLTGLTNISDDNSKGDINCTWSPDGRLIAYANGVFTQARLVMKHADDSDLFPIQLEDDMGSNNFDGNPDWAPDGSPLCPDDGVTTTPGKAITLRLECADTGPDYELTDPSGFIANDGGPEHGTVSDEAPLANPSTVVYTPDAGFTGTDRVVYSSFDEFGFGKDRGTIEIKVEDPVVDPPKNMTRCAGRTATITGTSGSDVIRGTKGRDIISAGSGADRVNAGRGNDIVCAGKGRDRVEGGVGRDRISGGSGADHIRGGRGFDRCAGGQERDRVVCERGSSVRSTLPLRQKGR